MFAPTPPIPFPVERTEMITLTIHARPGQAMSMTMTQSEANRLITALNQLPVDYWTSLHIQVRD